MAILAYDDVMLREPRLLVPRMAPVGHCVVRPEFADAKLIYCPAIGGTRNLAPVKGAGSASGVIMPITGTVLAFGTAGGMAHAGTATGDYILSGIGPNTGEHLSTMLVVVDGQSFGATARLFSTRYDASTASDYAGFYGYITSAGAASLEYGDATGSAPTDRRTLQSAAGAVPTSGVVGLAGRFLTSTTGQLFINGVPQSLTASGTGGTIGGNGNIQIHDYHALTATAWAKILLLALFNVALPASVEQSLSYDPFQIFAPA